MNCPIDGEVLLMMERQGIEIDYCPSCRGVWLDRGELDKLIEAADVPDERSPRPADDRDERRGEYQGGSRDGDGWNDRSGKTKKKKSSFLSDLFEMGG